LLLWVLDQPRTDYFRVVFFPAEAQGSKEKYAVRSEKYVRLGALSPELQARIQAETNLALHDPASAPTYELAATEEAFEALRKDHFAETEHIRRVSTVPPPPPSSIPEGPHTD
jgi:hypothetical protein